MSCRHICRLYNLHPHKRHCFHKTTNPKPSSIFHSTHHYAFQNFPFHFPPICGDTYIVQYLYCDVDHTRALPTPGLFPIFSFSHQKNTTRISCGVVVPSPANFIVITMDLARVCPQKSSVGLFPTPFLPFKSCRSTTTTLFS